MPTQVQSHNKSDEDLQIVKSFEESLNAIITEHHGMITSFSADQQVTDVHTKYLLGKLLEIEKLRVDIQQHDNPGEHFTKQYRILEGYGTKSTTDLDAIDVFGRDSLRATRKKALQDVDDLMKVLATKAHQDGMICQKCEVKS